MNINTSPLGWDTEDFLNVVFRNMEYLVPGVSSPVPLREFYQRKMMDIGMQGKGNLVALHKKVLGKQNYCWNGEFRFWVWEGPGWRLFVNNTKGASFEVLHDLPDADKIALYLNYVNQF